MAGLKYDKIIKYSITANCDGPLRIGSANGGKEEVLIHPVDGNPFIQASSIAGALRDYCNKISGPADALFGNCEANNAEDSRIKISDGIFISAVKFERRPHVKINRASGSVAKEDVSGSEKESGQKFELDYIGEGQSFKFETLLYIDSKDKMNLEQAYEDILRGIGNKLIRFGGKKSSGAGIIGLDKVYKNAYNLTNENDLLSWINNKDTKVENITDELKKTVKSGVAYIVSIIGSTEGGIQVRGLAENEFGKGVADSSNIKNINGQYIIPGSSVKGSMRSQMEKIAEYINADNVIEDAFGKVGKNDTEGSSGNILFKDVIINNAKVHHKSRVHINKFTGGVINPFFEDNICGDLCIDIEILNKNNPKKTLGLLLFAIRDLSIGCFSIGNGYANGKGIIKVKEIKIADGSSGEDTTINLRETSMISKPIVNEAINSLKKESK